MDQERNHLWEYLAYIGTLMHRCQAEAYRGNGSMASPYKGQGRILGILKLKPEISHKELSYLLGISTQSMSELLRKLESKGYIMRVPSEQDKRSMNIILTEEGKKAVDQSKGFDNCDMDQVFDCLNEEEQAKFKEYLERLEREMLQRLDPENSSEYTFSRIKEMHDMILNRSHRERPHQRGRR